MWSGFVPQKNLDEVFGTSNEIHELLQAGFVILDERCVVSVVSAVHASDVLLQ